MNAANPFQIPACLQTRFQQRRQARFKQGVIGIVAGTTVLLAVLLILGCNREQARAASARAVAADDLTTTPATSGAEPRLASPPTSPAPSPIVALAAAPVVSKAGATVPAGRPATIYVVKPADTLSRIAKAHGTTVNAVKVANGLNSDRIGIGMKLKLPEV